jgi:hypothetical protein
MPVRALDSYFSTDESISFDKTAILAFFEKVAVLKI